ncbi:MAG: hypothetical protein JXR68_01430 [Bacteroidales bacterium]|nr:hypothetical protein [Bacteroidales bacterium]
MITSFYIWLFPLNYNSPNNTRWWLINKTLDKTYNLQDSTIKILFLGDSRPNAGINFNKIKNSWSFCVGGASPIENYYILQKYLNTYNKPETLFLSISPRFLTTQFAFWDMAVRNKFFSKNDFKEIFYYNKITSDTLLNKAKKIKFFLYNINFIKYYQDDIRKSLVFFSKSKNLKLINFIMNNKGKRPHPDLKNYCSDLNFEASIDSFPISPIYDFYFTKIFETCLENDIFCVFYSMPMNQSSYEKLNKKFVNQYSTYINSQQIIFPLFDINPNLYSFPDSLFGDESHLNFNGQTYYTEQFLKKYPELIN